MYGGNYLTNYKELVMALIHKCDLCGKDITGKVYDNSTDSIFPQPATIEWCEDCNKDMQGIGPGTFDCERCGHEFPADNISFVTTREGAELEVCRPCQQAEIDRKLS